jgi:hypothetical protein
LIRHALIRDWTNLHNEYYVEFFGEDYTRRRSFRFKKDAIVFLQKKGYGMVSRYKNEYWFVKVQ